VRSQNALSASARKPTTISGAIMDDPRAGEHKRPKNDAIHVPARAATTTTISGRSIHSVRARRGASRTPPEEADERHSDEPEREKADQEGHERHQRCLQS
jgi:hypothetical protein